MKYQLIFPGCLLLLWTLTAFVSCEGENKIVVKLHPDGIVLSCKDTKKEIRKSETQNGTVGLLMYRDENSGEYVCATPGVDIDTSDPRIYVKFRTCDNCIQLDTASTMGIVIGDVVATIAIGVAVYLIAAHAQTSPVTSYKKSSDRQHLVPNEVSSRPTNDHYQRLRHKGGQKDTYDVINNRR
ncbi:T-cell surface glycoprotein CD3 delta chain-like [Trachinotus anak]|uniref:T-cell surface glycoprotein CD3 delta chain-like n=1 Tax=Trachinotus anak TaxID=443729 RepID=UPI0039F1DC72